MEFLGTVLALICGLAIYDWLKAPKKGDKKVPVFTEKDDAGYDRNPHKRDRW